MADVSNVFYQNLLAFLTSKNSGFGSILRLNAWKISNQNIQDTLWAFFRKQIFSAKLEQFGDNLRPNLSKNFQKFRPLGTFQMFLSIFS